MKKEYAIYKGEDMLFIGTVEECAKRFNVKKETVYFWASPANIRRADTGFRPGTIPRRKETTGIKIAIRLYKKTR